MEISSRNPPSPLFKGPGEDPFPSLHWSCDIRLQELGVLLEMLGVGDQGQAFQPIHEGVHDGAFVAVDPSVHFLQKNNFWV